MAGATLPVDAQEGDVRVRISGVLVDSVEMRPVAGATVQLVGRSDGARSRSVVTATNGSYAFDSVHAGRYLLGFLNPALEDLGVELPIALVDVREPGDIVVPLAVPSSHTVIVKVCGPTNPLDSLGLYRGTVRSARDGMPVPGATVRVDWSEITIDKQATRHSRPGISIKANADGAFSLCHVPMGTTTRVRAWSATDSSGFVDVTVPTHGLVSRDLYLGAALARRVTPGTDVVTSDTVNSITLARGAASLVGTIRRAEGDALVGARVTIYGTGIEATTNSSGSFRLDSLPSGTWTLDARAVGFLPQRVAVDLTSAEPSTVTMALDAIETTLDTVKVLSTRIYTAGEVAGFETRRKMGFGVMLDEKALERMGQTLYTSDYLRRIPGVTVSQTGPTRFGFNVLLRGTTGRLCAPGFYLDGVKVRTEVMGVDEMVEPANIKYLEVYAKGSLVPPEFVQQNQCGVIVITTKQRK